MSIFGRRAMRRAAAYQSELIKTYYAEVDVMYRKMRTWRHDYRNHIQTMKTLAESGDLESVKKYLDALGTELETVDTVIKTGNKMADAILNSKISLARSKEIEVEAEAKVATALQTSEVDLCAIIGNLFDNAIDASLGLPKSERMIRVYMEMKGTQLYMSFTNMTSGGKLRRNGSLFSSTKGGEHGLGLARIDDIVNKYGGYVRRGSESGAFTTEILLPQAAHSVR